MLRSSLLFALLLLACSPAAVPPVAARSEAPEHVAVAPRGRALALGRHAGRRLAPPFAEGSGTRRIEAGELATALATAP